MNSIAASLEFYEDFLFIQDIEEKPFGRRDARGPEKGLQVPQMVNKSPDKYLRYTAEIKLALKNIYGDGIHADHNEEERPFLISLDIDDKVKEGKKEHTPAAGK